MNFTEAILRTAGPDSTTIVSSTHLITAEETSEKMGVEDSASKSSINKTVCTEQNYRQTSGEYIAGGQGVFPSSLGSPSPERAAQEDSDIFMKTSFSEDYAYTEL